jgi:hypothetical protein
MRDKEGKEIKVEKGIKETKKGVKVEDSKEIIPPRISKGLFD